MRWILVLISVALVAAVPGKGKGKSRSGNLAPQRGQASSANQGSRPNSGQGQTPSAQGSRPNSGQSQTPTVHGPRPNSAQSRSQGQRPGDQSRSRSNSPLRWEPIHASNRGIIVQPARAPTYSLISSMQSASQYPQSHPFYGRSTPDLRSHPISISGGSTPNRSPVNSPPPPPPPRRLSLVGHDRSSLPSYDSIARPEARIGTDRPTGYMSHPIQNRHAPALQELTLAERQRRVERARHAIAALNADPAVRIAGLTQMARENAVVRALRGGDLHNGQWIPDTGNRPMFNQPPRHGMTGQFQQLHNGMPGQFPQQRMALPAPGLMPPPPGSHAGQNNPIQFGQMPPSFPHPHVGRPNNLPSIWPPQENFASQSPRLNPSAGQSMGDRVAAQRDFQRQWLESQSLRPLPSRAERRRQSNRPPAQPAQPSGSSTNGSQDLSGFSEPRTPSTIPRQRSPSVGPAPPGSERQGRQDRSDGSERGRGGGSRSGLNPNARPWNG